MSNDAEIRQSLKRIEDLLTAMLKTQLSDCMEKEFCKPDMKMLYDSTCTCTARDDSKTIICSLGIIFDGRRKY